MAADFSLLLDHFGMSRNLKRQWPSRRLFQSQDVWNFHLIETRLFRELKRGQGNRTLTLPM
jgi:hypothetical protein